MKKEDSMKWTPISESMPWMNTGLMPPKRGRVLVTVQRLSGKRTVEQAFYNGGGRGSYAFGKAGGRILAWAPMPEPYTGPTREQLGPEATDFELALG